MIQHLTKQFQKAKEKAIASFLTLSLFLSNFLSSTVYANTNTPTNDPFSKTSNLASQGITKVQGVGIVTFGLAVVITGLVYGLGGRELKAAVKKHWVAIAVGIIAVAAGPSAIEWFWKFVTG